MIALYIYLGGAALMAICLTVIAVASILDGDGMPPSDILIVSAIMVPLWPAMIATALLEAAVWGHMSSGNPIQTLIDSVFILRRRAR